MTIVASAPAVVPRHLVAVAEGGSLRTADVGEVLLVCGIGAAVGFAAGLALTLGLRWLARCLGVSLKWTAATRSPIVALFVVVAVKVVLELADAQREWAEFVVRLLDIALIAIVGWIMLVIARVIEKGALAKFPARSLEDRRSRHARTKITLLRRVTDAVVVTIVVAAALWTIPAVREVGVGIFASAGVVGIVFGLAAQTSLANIFAGLQIAFTDGIRIDDIVDIEGQWGRIEEITLTYVVLRVWDGTSLILPCTYFTTTPFLNWTHQGTSATGIVEIGVDWTVPVDELRQELGRILARSSKWDGQKGELHVEDASGPIVTLIAEVSAPDGDSLTPLRREVREGLVQYIQREHTDAVPRSREESTTRLVAPDGETIERLVGAHERLISARSANADPSSGPHPPEES
jgi:small-conductance mechanosensitive channel